MSTRTENPSVRPAVDGVKGARILIVESRYYPEIADALISGADTEIKKNGATYDRVVVPGAFEIPGAIALAAVATSDSDLEFLTALLDGTAHLEGLAVDTDLRWALLRRLVSRGVRGEDAIDAELHRDATDAGERHAAGCRAAVPTLTAKRETWETLTDRALLDVNTTVPITVAPRCFAHWQAMSPTPPAAA